jgi:hypothetical protein
MTGNSKKNKPYVARFRRYECKYLITESQAEAVRRYIAPFVNVDAYAAGSPDRSYDIASIYLDSPDLRLFRESQEGVLDRIKLRIRHYSEAAAAPVFLEIKRRHNRLVLKGRARLDRDAASLMLAGGVPDTSRLAIGERASYEEFVGWVGRWIARPLIWVKYRREAFVGLFDTGIRITMDRNLLCSPTAEGNGLLPTCSWRPIENRRVVLELKFNHSYPDWMRCLAQRFNLKQRSYSKYGKAVLRGIDAWRLSSGCAWSLPMA